VLALPAGLALGEFLLEPPRIKQDQLGELAGPVRRDDRPPEALVDDVRDEPAVVEVSVGEEDRVEGGRVEAERDAVADGLARAALEHAAVDEDACTLRDEQELGSGNCGRTPEKVNLHRRILPRRRWQEASFGHRRRFGPLAAVASFVPDSAICSPEWR
jgi:hypothetical protein